MAEIHSPIVPEGQAEIFETRLRGLEQTIARQVSRDRVAEIWSAVPLTEEEKEALRAKLARRFGDNLHFRFQVDPSLLGGVKVRVGDQIINGSVAGKLEALREQLLSTRELAQ